MNKKIDDITDYDKIVHEPARLAILTALTACKKADFVFLQRLTGVSRGNLSNHLQKLEEAEYVEIEKTFSNKKPRTLISITKIGKEAVKQHWDKLDQLRENANHLMKEIK